MRAWPWRHGCCRSVAPVLTGVGRRGTVARFSGRGPDMFGTTTGRVSGRTARSFSAVAFAVAAFSVITASPSRAASWLEKNFWLSGPNYSRALPVCDYPPALDRLIDNFRTKEFRFWNSELRIVGVENIREIGFLP